MSSASDLPKVLDALEEPKLLCNLHHPHVTSAYGVVEDPSHGPGMVSEYMDCGSLHSALRKRHLSTYNRIKMACHAAEVKPCPPSSKSHKVACCELVLPSARAS